MPFVRLFHRVKFRTRIIRFHHPIVIFLVAAKLKRLISPSNTIVLTASRRLMQCRYKKIGHCKKCVSLFVIQPAHFSISLKSFETFFYTVIAFVLVFRDNRFFQTPKQTPSACKSSGHLIYRCANLIDI